MKITRLYVDDQGETHFEDIEVPWKESTAIGKLTERQPATGIIFRQVQADYDLDWHNAPRKQYIINLDASVEITVSDGEATPILGTYRYADGRLSLDDGALEFRAVRFDDHLELDGEGGFLDLVPLRQ